MRWIFPGAVVPEVPAWCLIVSGGLFALTILWALLSLFWDFCLALRWLWLRRPVAMPHSRRVAIVFVAALGLTLVSVWQGVRVPTVRTVELAVPDLPPALEGFRVVQLTDLHISALYRASWAREVVARANALKPDLVVITGDSIDGSTVDRAEDVAPLAQLRAPYGVFACVGNHEYYSGLVPWLHTLESLGIRVLLNAHTSLTVERGNAGQAGGSKAVLVLGGVADASGAARVGEEKPWVAKAFAGSPEAGPDTLRMLLAHQPHQAGQAAREKVGLQLSGHTHGGQIFPVSLLVGRFNSGYLAGMYDVDGMKLYVSRGAGLWAGFPVRLGAASEITEIILRRSDAAGAGPTR